MRSFRPYDPTWICDRYKHPCDKVDWSLRKTALYNVVAYRLWSAIYDLRGGDVRARAPSLSGQENIVLWEAQVLAVDAWRFCAPREVGIERKRIPVAVLRDACRKVRQIKHANPSGWAVDIMPFSPRVVP